jgi:hypothetical protein
MYVCYDKLYVIILFSHLKRSSRRKEEGGGEGGDGEGGGGGRGSLNSVPTNLHQIQKQMVRTC